MGDGPPAPAQPWTTQPRRAPAAVSVRSRPHPSEILGRAGERGNQAGRRALGPGRSQPRPLASLTQAPPAGSSRLPSAPLARSRSAPGKAPYPRPPPRRGRPGPDLPSADAGPRPGGAAQTAWEPEPAAARSPGRRGGARAREARLGARPRPPAPLPRAAPAAAVQSGPPGRGRGRRAAPGSPGRGAGGPQVARHFSGGTQGRGGGQGGRGGGAQNPFSEWGAGDQEAERRPSPRRPSAVPWWGEVTG